MAKLLAFAGSTRKGSFNQSVLHSAADGAEQAGAQVTRISLADYPMPLYNQDEEAAHGIPEAAQAFKALMMNHDGFLIASPEYNSSYPALLKNALDWASRPAPDEPMLAAYKGKVAGIMSCSQGALGGMRVLVVLRMLLENLGVIVSPNQKAIGKVDTLMDEKGIITDARALKQLHGLGSQTADLAFKLAR